VDTNYFALYELPLSYDIDQKELTLKYYALSKQYHPDNFALEDVTAQTEALDKSTAVNQGYKILKQEHSRLRHLLIILGVTFEEGNEKMPQEFLMEMMDINEGIMEYKMDPSDQKKAQVQNQIETFEATLESQAQPALSNLDAATHDPEHLATLKLYYLKSKYLKRLKDNIEDRGVEM